MAIKIGGSSAKRIYLDTSKVKYVYLDNNLVFADPQALTLSLGTGVASVRYTVTEKDGKQTTGTATSTTTITVGYGASVTFSATASTGYTLGSYTATHTITADKTVSFAASINSVTVTIDLKYSGTEWGDSVGDKIGTVQYSTNNSTWTTTSAASVTVNYGSKIYIRNVSAAPGFSFSSLTYNGTAQTASGGVYTITATGNHSISVNYTSTTSTSSATMHYASSTTTNSLSRSAWTVTCNIAIAVSECAAGTAIATIPYQYRPATAKTVTCTWCTTTTNGNTSSTTATITINTNGTITSSLESTGSGSASGGGKWGSYSTAWSTAMTISTTWSVK